VKAWQIYDRLCRSEELEGDLQGLTAQELRELRKLLIKLDPNSGVPNLIAGLATAEAARRFQEGGAE
jgi:hypothetical protein